MPGRPATELSQPQLGLGVLTAAHRDAPRLTDMSVPHSGLRNVLMLSAPTAMAPFVVTATAFRLAIGSPVPAPAAAAPVTAIMAAAGTVAAAASKRWRYVRMADSFPDRMPADPVTGGPSPARG